MKLAIILTCLIASVIAAPSNNNSWRVFGGSNASKGQFPYQVSIRVFDEHSCGGSILDATTILTAAHCVDGLSTILMTVTLGANKLSEHTDEYEVAEAIAHPGYDEESSHNDIALIKLKWPIQFRDGVAPVKLPTNNIAEEMVTLSGWGMVSEPENYPDHLQFVELKTISVGECENKMGDIDETQVCTFTKRGEGSCSGDSGGPLVDTRGEQIGVVSFGIPCAVGYPDVFTRVYSYLDWIENNRK